MKPDNTRELALEIKHAFNMVSPFIEKHSARVCPECNNLCCKDKHGRYDKDDVTFLEALGENMLPEFPDRDESGPCRYMAEKGCSIERYVRPFRCTHFFCDPLLKSLENDNAKLYRAFVEYFQHLISIRQRLLD
ncbi:MAG: hypothetical protein JSW20_09425 [Nitrospiraceae bacterium]|nr:MAG: hypothetical protein JSW20_09425 [Nitrospiraceae bacterium]